MDPGSLTCAIEAIMDPLLSQKILKIYIGMRFNAEIMPGRSRMYPVQRR